MLRMMIELEFPENETRICRITYVFIPYNWDRHQLVASFQLLFNSTIQLHPSSQANFAISSANHKQNTQLILSSRRTQSELIFSYPAVASTRVCGAFKLPNCRKLLRILMRVCLLHLHCSAISDGRKD